MFAYKLEPWEMSALAHAPNWVVSDLYDIEATARGNPTKDQMRLMMQALLADRFKLAIHFQSRDIPVLAMTLATPGRTGPKLRPHVEGPPCPESFVPQSRELPHDPGAVFPKTCDTAQAWGKPDGTWLAGSRNTTMPQLAAQIFSAGRVAEEIDRPVVDRTGLAGTFDFTVEFVPRPIKPSTESQAAATGSADPVRFPFLYAIREQLGLRLLPATAPIRSLVVDHVERPSTK
jgi:uncharacterized protein (TIGR03435 family)